LKKLPNKYFTISIQSIPFKRSRTSTLTPINLELVISKEFIAPTFPEPVLVISTFLVFFKIINPVGIDPIR
jgi:hypothetical protein